MIDRSKVPQHYIARFKRLYELYPQLKAETEKKVQSWRWATLRNHSLEPFYFEMHNLPRGEFLAQRPEEIRGHFCYGFDKNGEVVVERYYPQKKEIASPELSSGEVVDERFIMRHNAVIEVAHFHEARATLQYIEYEQGVLQRSYKISSLTNKLFQYKYKNDLLVESSNYAWSKEGQHIEYVYEYSYETNGELKSITHSQGGVVYQSPPLEESFNDLAFKVEERVTELILHMIRTRSAHLQRTNRCYRNILTKYHIARASGTPAGQPIRASMAGFTLRKILEFTDKIRLTFARMLGGKLREPSEPPQVYALFLIYSHDMGLPPELYLCEESYRRKAQLNSKYEPWLPLWFDKGGEHYMRLDPYTMDKETAQLLSRHRQEVAMSQNGRTLFRESVMKISRALRENLLKNDLGLKLCDDFVVVPTDYRGVDLRKNIKEINPESYHQLVGELPTESIIDGTELRVH